MLEPREREAYGCRTCWDARLVLRGQRETECPDCASWGPDQREQRLRADAARRLPKPEITERDLTPEEAALFREWSITHAEAHPLTILSWIEGRRYDPRQDPEFMRLCERRMAKRRFYREDQEREIAARAPAGARRGF